MAGSSDKMLYLCTLFRLYDMNARKTLLFLFSVMAGLALLCYYFPTDGISLGWGINLHMPSPGEVLGAETPEEVEEEVAPEDTMPDLTPEQLLELRQDELTAAKVEEFRAYSEKNVARIYMPDDDETYLDAFWDAMQTGSSQHVRIMHYGDSQIECDRITSMLRQRFQESFGGMGVGLVPALQSVPTFTLRSSIHPDDVPQYFAYGPANLHLEDGFYGPLARVTHIPDSAVIQLAGSGGRDYPKASAFNRLTVITRQPTSLTITVSDTLEVEPTLSGEKPCFYTASLPRAVARATIKVVGETDILGIQLDGQSGISVDNIPMRGSSGNDLMRIGLTSIAPFFGRENVALIILQFGGNSVPYMTRSKLHDYKENTKRLIRFFKGMEPQAKILFIGPSDMAHMAEDGTMETYPILPAMNDSLRAAASEAGAAYWNMYAAMGGRGSMIRWVEESDPQLAGEDYIHFTPIGAKKIARILYDTLDFYYRYYRYRTGQDEAELTAKDSAAVDETIRKNEAEKETKAAE